MVLPLDLEAGGDGDEGEGVALAVADLEVVGVLCELRRGEFDCGDELVGLEVGVELRGGAGEAVEVGDGDGALAVGAVTWMVALRAARATFMSEGLVAMHSLACAEDGVDAVEAFDGGAAAAGSALVAGGEGGVHEVVAAGALHEVAAGGGHVAELRGGSAEKSVREERVVGADDFVVGEVAVADSGADEWWCCRWW